MIRSFGDSIPRIDPTVFLAEDVVVIGDVEIGRDASVWYRCVLRGDVGPIRIGTATNIRRVQFCIVPQAWNRPSWIHR